MNQESSNKQSGVDKYRGKIQKEKKNKRSGFCAKICFLIIIIVLILGYCYYQQIVPVANDFQHQYKNSNQTTFQLIKKTLEGAMKSTQDKINSESSSTKTETITETISTKSQATQNGVKVQSHSEKVTKTTQRVVNQNDDLQEIEEIIYEEENDM